MIFLIFLQFSKNIFHLNFLKNYFSKNQTKYFFIQRCRSCVLNCSYLEVIKWNQTPKQNKRSGKTWKIENRDDHY